MMVQSVSSESLQMEKTEKCAVLSSVCCSEGPQQAGAVGCQEYHAVQQGEVQSPEAGEEQTQAPVYAGGHPAESNWVWAEKDTCLDRRK